MSAERPSFPGVELDVRDLEAPEPMQRILQQLHQQEEPACLKVWHRREPIPLYDLLREAGYRHHCLQLSPSCFLIYIWPAAASTLQQQCLEDAGYENHRA